MGDTLKNLEDVYTKWEQKSQSDSSGLKASNTKGKICLYVILFPVVALDWVAMHVV